MRMPMTRARVVTSWRTSPRRIVGYGTTGRSIRAQATAAPADPESAGVHHYPTPVVDIQVSVPRLVPRADFVDPLVSLGFSHMVDPIDAQQEYLTKGYDPEADPKVHVHVCGSGSEWERRHLAFRDWLRAHPADAQRYGRLKADLAERHPNDIHSYVDDKTEFIRSIEALALSETKATGAPPAVP